MTTNLYLIRHGEAYSNVERRIEGPLYCRGLTERGIAQAEALARRLATGEIPADVVYASTLLRARMTAEIAAGALELPVHWDDDLHELRPGESDGWTFDELRERSPTIRRFVNDQFAPIAPGGESWGTFQARVSAALERIITNHTGQHIIVVAHGGVVEVAFMYLVGLPPMARTRVSFMVENTAITHWRHSQTISGRYEWQLMTHNDHRHLLALGER
jgi:probable phosphoglycerate mutase